nr:uncharacterized protein LOC129048073 [Pongo abelii]
MNWCTTLATIILEQRCTLTSQGVDGLKAKATFKTLGFIDALVPSKDAGSPASLSGPGRAFRGCLCFMTCIVVRDPGQSKTFHGNSGCEKHPNHLTAETSLSHPAGQRPNSLTSGTSLSSSTGQQAILSRVLPPSPMITPACERQWALTLCWFPPPQGFASNKPVLLLKRPISDRQPIVALGDEGSPQRPRILSPVAASVCRARIELIHERMSAATSLDELRPQHGPSQNCQKEALAGATGVTGPASLCCIHGCKPANMQPEWLDGVTALRCPSFRVF